MKVTIEELIPLFRDVLENEAISITAETVAADIEEWDSLNHIYLVVAIEKKYKMKFTTHQIQSWKSVGDMLIDLNK